MVGRGLMDKKLLEMSKSHLNGLPQLCIKLLILLKLNDHETHFSALKSSWVLSKWNHNVPFFFRLKEG